MKEKRLVNSSEKWRMKRALEMLKERKVTIRKAVEIAETSYVEMLDNASKAGIDIGYGIKELKEDLE